MSMRTWTYTCELVKHRKLRCRVFGHKWAAKQTAVRVGDAAVSTQYSECPCGARRVVQEGAFYQPVDWEWLTANAVQVKA